MSSIYELDGRVPLRQALTFGLQHILAMFVANITPIIILANVAAKKASDFEVLNDIAGEVIVENKEKLLANASSDEVREYIEKEYIEKLQEQ